jgi:hypothetical protein
MHRRRTGNSDDRGTSVSFAGKRAQTLTPGNFLNFRFYPKSWLSLLILRTQKTPLSVVKRALNFRRDFGLHSAYILRTALACRPPILSSQNQRQQQRILVDLNRWYACIYCGRRGRSARFMIMANSHFPSGHKFNLLSISISKVATCAHSVAQTLSTLSHA